MESWNFPDYEKVSPSQENIVHPQSIKRDGESLEDFEDITKDDPSMISITAQFLQQETGDRSTYKSDEIVYHPDKEFCFDQKVSDNQKKSSSDDITNQMLEDFENPHLSALIEPSRRTDREDSFNDLINVEQTDSQNKTGGVKDWVTEEPILNILDENKLVDVGSNDEISTGSDDLSFIPKKGESSPVLSSEVDKDIPKKLPSECRSSEAVDSSLNSQPLSKFTSEPGVDQEQELEKLLGDGLHVKQTIEGDMSENEDDFVPEPIPKDYPEISAIGGKEFLAAFGLELVKTKNPPMDAGDLKNVASQIVDEVQEKVRSKLSQNGPQEPTSTTRDSALSLINPYTWFQPDLLHPKVESLIYWRDPKKSGIVFGAGLIILLSLTSFSLISVVAYTSLIVLISALAFRIYKSVMQAVQKTSEGHPFKKYLVAVLNHPIITTVFNNIEEYLDIDLTVNPDKAREISDVIVSHVNGALTEFRRLFLIEDVIDSIKFGVVLWSLTYIGAWFNGLSLLIIAFVGLFTLPKVYENNKTQIDANINVVRTKINEITEKITAVIPLGKKTEENKEKGE